MIRLNIYVCENKNLLCTHISGQHTHTHTHTNTNTHTHTHIYIYIYISGRQHAAVVQALTTHHINYQSKESETLCTADEVNTNSSGTFTYWLIYRLAGVGLCTSALCENRMQSMGPVRSNRWRTRKNSRKESESGKSVLSVQLDPAAPVAADDICKHIYIYMYVNIYPSTWVGQFQAKFKVFPYWRT